MQQLYPETKEVLECLLNETEFQTIFPEGKEMIKEIKRWKNKEWKDKKDKKDGTKKLAIARLMLNIANKTNKGASLNGIKLDGYMPYMDYENQDEHTEGRSYYAPEERVIVIGGKASIITGLHELAHHIYGDSELKACVFSISLFKIAFPKAFEKLNWEGHMLRT